MQHHLLLGVAVTVLLAGCGSRPAEEATDTPPATPPGYPITTSSVLEPIAGDTTIPGEGTFRVGPEVRPGTYRSAPSEKGDGTCFWFRLKGLSGEPGDAIASGGEDGQALVTVKKSDAAFESHGCQTWQRTD